MNAIKEIPTNFRVYYKNMRNEYTRKKEEVENKIDNLDKEVNKLHKQLSEDYKENKVLYIVKLLSYQEFVYNKYINGEFFRIAEGCYLNKKNDYVLTSVNFNVYNYAKLQKELYQLKKDSILYDKLLQLSLKEYTNLLKAYYNKVHEKLICQGYGYAFHGKIGWICINRCHIINQKSHIDYNQTKLNKIKLIAEGKKLYNKIEAEWCKQNGIEYDGVDPRVYRSVEYVYEIPLLHSKLPNGSKLKFTTTNYYNRNIRNKSNEEIIKECNADKYKICKLDIDIRAKLDLCLKVDKILYSKFIRNESQKPSIA